MSTNIDVELFATPTEKRLTGFIKQALEYIETVEHESAALEITEPELTPSMQQLNTLKLLLTGSGECG